MEPSTLPDKDLEEADTSSALTNDVNIKSPSPQTSWKPSTAEWMIMVTLATSSLIVALDATILVPVLPQLAIDLHGTTVSTFWVGTSYLLTHAVFQPFIASSSDALGRQQLLIPSLSLFAVGSIICGVAKNFAAMLAGRVIQGLGGAGIITLTQVIFADIVPLRQRPKFFSFVLLAWAIGSVLGPLVGGAFVEKVTWRWCFYINLPICALALPMSLFFVRLRGPLSEAGIEAKIKHVDWLGNITFIIGLTSFLIGISWGGIQFSWSSAATLVPIILGVIIIALAIAWEAKFAVNPFLTRRLFSSSTIASFIAALLQGLTLYIALYYIAFFFLAVKLKSPINSGVSLFPATVLLLPGSAIVSALITRTGRYRMYIWVGWVLSTIGSGLFVMWDDKTSTAVWAVCECVFGLGMGMVLSSVNFSIQAVVDPEDAGAAAAMYAFFRSIGMTIGVAIGGSTFQNIMKTRLTNLDVPNASQIAKGAEAFITTLKHLETVAPTDPTTVSLMSGYVHGLRGVFEVMCAVCGVGLIVSLAIKHADMDKILDSKFVVKKRGKPASA